MLLIGLTGYGIRSAGSGKTTLAKYLEREHDFTRLSFATPLKIGVAAMFGLSYDQLTDPVAKEVVDPVLGMSPRSILQFVGTEVCRGNLGSNIWIKLLDKELNKTGTLPNRVVIDDVRFDNEATYVRASGGDIIHIDATARLRIPAKLFSASMHHISEKGITVEQDDYVIYNNDDTALMFKKMDKIMSHITEKSVSV